MSVAPRGAPGKTPHRPPRGVSARRYEEAWQSAERTGSRLDPAEFLSELGTSGMMPGPRLAVLRTDLALRWDAGDRIAAGWYLDGFPDLDEDSSGRACLRGILPPRGRRREPEPPEFFAPISRLLPSLCGACWTSTG